MRFRSAVTAAAVCALALATAGQASAQQPDKEVERVKTYLTGKVQFYYRVGGAIYGTHHLVDIEYKASGQFALSVDTAKTTILDNVQRGGWRDGGQWDVVRMGRQVGIRHRCDSGTNEFFPVEILANGDVRLLADGFAKGTETFWMVQGWKYRFQVNPPSITLVTR